MDTATASAPARLRVPRWRPPDAALLVSSAVLLAAVIGLQVLKPKGLSYFDLSSTAASAAPLVLAAIGETVVVIAGGLDLSVGAVLSLVNVTLVSVLGMLPLGTPIYAAAAVALAAVIGMAAGTLNGAFVGYLGMTPVVATLGTMFIAQGLSLLIMPFPGGQVTDAFSTLLTGDLIQGVAPMPVVLIVAGVIGWQVIRRRRLGTAIYAVGSDAESACANRVNVPATSLLAYAIGGVFYGMAGLFVTANTGSADPLIGTPMLLKVFAAVVLGGTAIGGGRGDAGGTAIGALTLTVVVTLFLIAGVKTYYVPGAEGLILLLAVLGFALRRHAPVLAMVRRAAARHRAAPSAKRPAAVVPPATVPRHAGARTLPWLQPRLLRVVLPPWLLFAATVLATAAIYGSGFTPLAYIVSVLTFATFLAVLGLGQGAVVIGGGLDLSVIWGITLPAVVLTTLANGTDSPIWWAVPLSLAIGGLVGLFNGTLIVGFGLSPIIVTLAVSGLLETATLVLSGGAPTGSAPPALAWFVNRRLLGVPPIVLFLMIFSVGAYLLLNRSAYGRHVIAVGSNAVAARFYGVPVGATIIGTYVLSGLCAALVGLLLAGFTTQASFDMGKPYLLASIAVVVLGGTDIRGGRGHYLGILGGALTFTALGTMLAATSLPEALRSVVYGIVLLAAVLFLNRRSA